MTENDADIIDELCKDSLHNDTDFGTREAGNFYSWFENPDSKKVDVFGIFNGDKLAGLVSVLKFEEVDFAQIRDLFVNKENRYEFFQRFVKHQNARLRRK
jgi:hypothetical protein